LKQSVPLVLLALLMLGFCFSPQTAKAAPHLTVTPASQTIPQTSTALYTVSLSGASPDATYALTLPGLPSGAVYAFTPSAITGSGTSVLAIQTSAPPVYCPNSYSFNVTATNIALGSDKVSALGTLVLTQSGPSLSVALTTDKTSYIIGDTVLISITLNRAAEGSLTISPPTGQPSVSQYQTTNPTTLTKSFATTGQPAGAWAVAFQADDYCGGVGSAATYFDLVATYSVSISLTGVPSSASVNIQVDGQSQGTMGGSETRTLSFTVGSQHFISVDQYVQGSTGVRYFASQNNWGVASAGSHTFSYVTQYSFTVGTNPNGLVQISGAGWYNAGSQVQAGAPQSTYDPSGTLYVFLNWQVDGALQPGNPIQITMDKPHTAIAAFQPSAATTIISTITNAHTSTTSVTSTIVTTGTTISTSIVTQSGIRTVSSVVTSTLATQQGTTITAITYQTLTTPFVAMQIQDPNLELLFGSILVISVTAIAITLARRSPPRKQIVCSSCGFRNPPTATSFCVNCGQSLKGGRTQ
jgi:hypothetical protein